LSSRPCARQGAHEFSFSYLPPLAAEAFNDYAFDKRKFGRSELEQQIKANAGADGWLLWDPNNRYPIDVLVDLAHELWWPKTVTASS
jgi:hypothetical protein